MMKCMAKIKQMSKPTMFIPIIFCRSSVEAAMYYGYGGTMFIPIIFCRSSVERL